MAKQSGLGDNFYVAQYNLSGDINAVGSISGGPTAEDVTGIDKSAYERIGGLRNGAIEFTSYFNPTRAHPALSALPYGDVIITYLRGTTLGKPAACMVAKQTNYDGSRGDDGSFRFTISAQSNGYGIEWGRQLTAGLRTDTEATNGTSLDLGTGSTSHGLQAYLHVVDFDGTDATITIQESDDDGDTDAFADVTGGTFAEVTGATSERIATASDQTIGRYLRVVTSTTGGFTNLVFAVVVVRNDTEVRF